MNNRKLADEIEPRLSEYVATSMLLNAKKWQAIIAALRAAPAEQEASSWTCGCGWVNGINLSQCAMCLRTPAKGKGELKAPDDGTGIPIYADILDSHPTARPDAGASDPMGGMHSLLPLVEQVINDSIGFLAEPDAGASEEMVVIYSGEHGMYWGANGSGFVRLREHAGRYTQEDAERRIANSGSEKLLQIAPAVTEPDAGAAGGLTHFRVEELRIRLKGNDDKHLRQEADLLCDMALRSLTSYASGWADAREAAAKAAQEHIYYVSEMAKNASSEYVKDKWLEQRGMATVLRDRIRALSPPSTGGEK